MLSSALARRQGAFLGRPGAYHFAHSPPFNTVWMVAFLSVIRLVTSLFFFVSRDVYGTIVFHNIIGVLGVANALEAKGKLQAMAELQPWLLATAATTVFVLVAADRFALRRTLPTKQAHELRQRPAQARAVRPDRGRGRSRHADTAE